MARRDVSHIFADMVANITYDDLPPEVVEVTKNQILDTIGVIVAATTLAPEPREIVKLVIDGGGKKESTILGYGDKVPCYMAAFANGALCHALDYDDLAHLVGHIGITTVPAALAMSERIGNIGGRELLTAVAAGNEIFLRLGLAVTGDTALREWFLTPVLGSFSASATSGKLLGLSARQLVDAFGIALSQAAGSKEMGLGGIVRAIYGAFPAKTGVLSSLLAGQGVAAAENSMEGSAGLFNVYFHGQYDANTLTDGLGRRFESASRIGFKPWCACGYTHPYIDAVLGLVKDYDIASTDVELVTAYVDARGQALLCEPLQEKRKPQTSISAKFSIPFTAAIAMAHKWVSLASFTADGLRDARVLELAERVTTQIHPDAGKVDIMTKDGRLYSRKVQHPLGFPQNPLSNSQIEAKFRECMSYSIRPFHPEAAERLISLVRKLEETNDVKQIVELCASCT